MRCLVLFAAMCWSCTSPPPPKPVQESQLPPPPPIVAPAPPPVATQPPPRDPCPSLRLNEVSNDETPSIAGTSGNTKAGEWLEARGVSKATFRGWVRSRDPKNLEDFDGDSIYESNDCPTLKVGDKNEDALVCTLAVRTSIMRYSATVFVVRNKRLVSVLEAGYSLPAMDWDTSWLDLQVSFSAGGLEADIHDRAKPGAVLVPSPNDCRKYFADNGSLPPESPMGDGRIALSGCDEALPKLDQLIKESGSSSPFVAEFRGDRAFAVKSCKARGHYTWKTDRFVRSGP